MTITELYCVGLTQIELIALFPLKALDEHVLFWHKRFLTIFNDLEENWKNAVE